MAVKPVITIQDQASSGNNTSTPGAAYITPPTSGPQPLYVLRAVGRSAGEDVICLTKMTDGTITHIPQAQLKNTGAFVTIK